MQRKNSANSSSGFASFAALFFYVVIFSLIGIVTYNIVEPDSLLGVVGFLISWGVLWAIIQLILAYVFIMIAAILN